MMKIYAKSCNKPFVVSKEKSKEFLNSKPSHNPLLDDPKFKEFCKKIKENSKE